MESIDLEFFTTASQQDGGYRISGIPDKLWEVFKEAAKKTMPEKGNQAWASVLTEIIQKHVIGNTFTYIMTEIPQEAKDAFDQVAAQADLSTDHIIGVMFKQAMEKKLHILNMISEDKAEEGYRVLVIAGLSESSWQKWAEVAKSVKLAPEELIGVMFEAASSGSVNIEPAPLDEHNVDFTERL